MATLSRVSEIRRNSCQKDKNARSESDLKQILLIDSDDTTHYRPAIPGVVSTSKEEKFDIASYSLLAKFESLKHGISALEFLYRVFIESQFRDSSAYS